MGFLRLEPRFTCHHDQDGQVIFEITGDYDDYFYECDQLMDWLKQHHGEPVEEFAYDSLGRYVLSDNGVYEIRPFTIYYLPGYTSAATEFRLRWC